MNVGIILFDLHTDNEIFELYLGKLIVEKGRKLIALDLNGALNF